MFVEQQQAAGAQDPDHLRQGEGRVRHAAQHQAGDNDVGRGIRRRQRFRHAVPHRDGHRRLAGGGEGQRTERGVRFEGQHTGHRGRVEREGGPVARPDFDDEAVRRRHEPAAVLCCAAGVHPRTHPGIRSPE